MVQSWFWGFDLKKLIYKLEPEFQYETFENIRYIFVNPRPVLSPDATLYHKRGVFKPGDYKTVAIFWLV